MTERERTVAAKTMRLRGDRERAVWSAVFAAAWVNSFYGDLRKRHERSNIDGSFDETMADDHAEEAITLAVRAVEQLREWPQ